VDMTRSFATPLRLPLTHRPFWFVCLAPAVAVAGGNVEEDVVLIGNKRQPFLLLPGPPKCSRACLDGIWEYVELKVDMFVFAVLLVEASSSSG
jgi:hypothetical protein